MTQEDKKDRIFCREQSGIALILTIVVLVALSAIVYRLSSNLVAQRHRQQYIIDYQKARYACESGLKYALSVAKEIDPNYVARPNEPDFSDLFTMSDEEYKELISQWAQDLGVVVDVNKIGKDDFLSRFVELGAFGESNDINDFNNMEYEDYDDYDYNEPNYVEELVISGPYGPAWPYISEPITFNMGDAIVTIKIEDENAKLPMNWGISGDAETKRESEAAFVVFCEWMQMEPEEIELFKGQLKDMKEIKEFKLDLKPVVTIKKVKVETKATKRGTSRRKSRRNRRSARKARSKTVKTERPQIGHIRDFAKLMHSPLLDIEKLAKPVDKTESRNEYALKYLSLWGTQRVNINSAPRHVLESAFTYGGDAVDIAEAIIQARKYEPFVDINDIQEKLMRYNDSIEKSKPYITTQSTVFTIRATAISGVAKVSATAAVKRNADKIEKIGIISD